MVKIKTAAEIAAELDKTKVELDRNYVKFHDSIHDIESDPMPLYVAIGNLEDKMWCLEMELEEAIEYEKYL